MPKLKCVGNYVNGPAGLVYRKGDSFEADVELFAFLMADAPGCFEEVKAVAAKQVDAPPLDKALKEPAAKK